jgi:hypothetical protein
MKLSIAAAFAVALVTTPSFAQEKSAGSLAAAPAEKPSIANYLSGGFQVIQSEIGNPFLQFILKKDSQLVWCSVELRSGETQSCRTIK